METMNKTLSDEILLKFSLNNSKKGKDYLIEFSLEDNSIKFETEIIRSKTDNSLLEFSKNVICPYYFYKIQNINLRIKRWKDRVHYIYLKFGNNIHLALSTIISAKNMEHQIQINEKDENSEKIIIKAEKSNNSNNNSLFNYLSAGLSFESYIGIDFSNKMLHNVDIEKNQYINAIRGFRETLFDFQRNFEVYGFGTNLLECKDKLFFNLSLSENPNLLGLTNIKQAYAECLEKIDFDENNNNYLSPLINHIQKRVYENYNLTNYNILFLLINKCPKKDDMKNTIDALIHTSFLPLSIVIIGIGDDENEFNNIKNLYMNNNISSKGTKKLLNNIFFISMKECNYDDSILKNKCLKEIPRQLTAFYELANISIKQIKEKNVHSIYQSLQNLNIQNNANPINNDANTNTIIDCTDEDSNPAPPLVIGVIEEEKHIFVSENYIGGNSEVGNNSNSYINYIPNNINLGKSNNEEIIKIDNNNNNDNNNNDNKNEEEINIKKSSTEKGNYYNIINSSLNINNNTDNSISRQKSNNDVNIGIKNIFNPDCSVTRNVIRKKTHEKKKSMETIQNKILDSPNIDNHNNNNLIKSNIIKEYETKMNQFNNMTNTNKNIENNNNNNAYKRLETISEGSSYNYDINNQFGNNNNNNNKTNNMNTFLSIEEKSLLSENKDNLIENKTKNVDYTKLSYFHIENNPYAYNNDNFFLGNTKNEEQNSINIQQNSINTNSINNSIQQSISYVSSNLNDSQQSEICFASRLNMNNN